MKKRGVTILFVSHDVSSVRQMCNRVLWIESGKQKMFDDSDKVCDLYMDEKRMKMNQGRSDNKEMLEKLEVLKSNKKKKYPRVVNAHSAIKSNKVEVVSAFVTNSTGEIVQHLTVEEKYNVHIVAYIKENMEQLIFGCVMENNKGIPLYDFNNYINTNKVISGNKGEIIEVIQISYQEL